MLLRSILLFATTLLCIACGGGKVQHAEVSAPVDVRTVRIENSSLERGATDTLRLGRLRSGEIIAKTIRVVNESDQPLVFTRHHVSCGCLRVKYDRKPIAKGASSDIELEFDSRTMMGLQLKTLVLYYAENARPMRIFVEAEVE